MEPSSTTAEAAQASPALQSDRSASSLAASPHAYSRACADAGCSACDTKRKKKRQQNLNYRGGDGASGSAVERKPRVAGVAQGGGALAGTAFSPSVLPAPVPVKPVIPWTVELVRPLVSQLVKVVERWDSETLIEEARKINDACAEFVRQNVAWNAEARGILIEGGAECVVKYLNLTGISAEYAPEIKVGIAALSIIYARQTLVAELRAMAAEVKAKTAKKPEEKAA